MSDYDRLRELLLADERGALARAETRIDALDRARDGLAAQLPVLVRAAPVAAMGDALAAPVAQALGQAVRQNSTPIVDALFPVIGPLIRKSIAEALRNLMGDINSALEHSFTPRGLRWRFEAWRSGVPFAQVVLKHTVRYRIDHVFLIERDSGLVLQRASAPGVVELDADAIAGMLTAIGQFVRDSVGQARGALEEARVGEYLLWLTDGPRASIAAFIQGVPPDALRDLLVQRLEEIHAASGESGLMTAAAIPQVSIDAEALALAVAPGAGETRPVSRWPALVLLLAGLVAAGVYAAREERWQDRLGTLRVALEGHPGFVLSSIDEGAGRSLRVRGLLDADAEPIAPLLSAAELGDATTRVEVEGYVSSDDAIVLRRARRLLDVPPTVDARVRDGRLVLTGTAAQAWIDAAVPRAAWVPGVKAVGFEVVPAIDAVAEARAALDDLANAVEDIDVRFVRDVEGTADVAARVDEIAAALVRAQALAGIAGRALRIEVSGFSDTPGGDALNTALRDARAHWLRDALVARGIGAELLSTVDPITRDDPAGSTMAFRGARARLRHEAIAR